MERRSATGSRPATSSPSMVTRPPVGSTMRLTIWSSVDLPDPEEPTRATVRWEGTVSEKSVTAAVPPG